MPITQLSEMEEAKVLTMIIATLVNNCEKTFTVKELSEVSKVPMFYIDEILLLMLQTMHIITLGKSDIVGPTISYNNDLLYISLMHGQVEQTKPDQVSTKDM